MAAQGITFTPRAVAPLDATIVDVLPQLIHPIAAAGKCDVRADDVFKVFTWNVAEYEAEIIAASDQLDAYIDSMGAHRRESLTGDLISELIRAEDDADRLMSDELRMLAFTILMPGTDTTRNHLAAEVDVFCDHPESPVIFSAMRFALEDVELAGMVIPACTVVMCNTAAANRNPDVYDEPGRLGANLARRELAEALTVMAQQVRNPRRTGPAPWKPIVGISGPATLPIEFEAA